MEKSILSHQRELIAIQKNVIKELQEEIFNAKYSSKDRTSLLEELDTKVEKVVERVEKKSTLINHYYGETVV